MPNGINEVTLLGNLGSDPEVRTTPSGKSVANVSLATTYKMKGGEDQTEWHRLVLWEPMALWDLKKGDTLYIKGRLQTRQWEKDGTKMYTTEVVVSDLRGPFNSRKSSGGTTGTLPVEEFKGDDGLPF